MYANQTEGQIWAEFLDGQIEAYEYIYRTYSPILFSYGIKISADKAFVQDCIQEIFITLLLKRESISQSNSIKFYLFKSLRRRIVRELEIRDKFIPFENELAFDAVFNADLNQAEIEISHEQAQKLFKELNNLPPRQKEAITLRFYENLSYAEVAKIMEIETTSAYKIIYKGIESLHKKISLDIVTIFLVLIKSAN